MEEKKDPAAFSNLNNSNTISSDDSSNALHIEKYLAEWEKICIEFFNNGNKTNEIVIRLVENGKITNGDIKVIDFSVMEEEEEENTTAITKEELENILKKIGFVNGVIVHPGKYHEIKRKARSDWHKKKALELIQELDRLLHCRPAQYTPPHRRSELSGYVNQYKESIGAKPFIKGLSKAFRLQLTKPSLVSWTFLDDTLTQNGVDFMRATVNLLVNVLGFTHTIQEVDESGEQGSNSLRTWYFSSNIDDKEVRSLLELLPKERSSMLNNVRITGTIELSSQPRPSRMIKSSSANIIRNVIFFPLKLLFLWFRLFRWCISLCVSIGVSSMKRESARDGTLSEIRV